jgi:hypothetical protein
VFTVHGTASRIKSSTVTARKRPAYAISAITELPTSLRTPDLHMSGCLSLLSTSLHRSQILGDLRPMQAPEIEKDHRTEATVVTEDALNRYHEFGSGASDLAVCGVSAGFVESSNFAMKEGNNRSLAPARIVTAISA